MRVALGTNEFSVRALRRAVEIRVLTHLKMRLRSLTLNIFKKSSLTHVSFFDPTLGLLEDPQ